MTSTLDPTELVGVSVVLKPSLTPQVSSPLTEWFAESSLAWVPLATQQGVTKAMLVSSQSQDYLQLWRSLREHLADVAFVSWQDRDYEAIGIERHADVLHLLELELRPQANLPQTVGRAIHALCLHWLARADSALSERVHEQPISPLSMAYDRKRSRLKIGLLQAELLSPLLWGMGADLGTEIALCGISCQLANAVAIVAASRFELLTALPVQTALELHLLSPSSFKRDNVIQPLPLPALVFSNLHRRWNSFAPENLRFPKVDWQGAIAAFDLKTVALKLGNRPELGATGWIRYQFRDPEQAAIATALAHFAYFSGIGRKTAMGMGQAKLRVSGSP